MSSRKYKKKINKHIARFRRTSRRRSFGFSGMNSTATAHFKKFLMIILFVLIRSIVKGQPYGKTFDNDFSSIEWNALNVLTITSILEIIEKIVGREHRDKILLAYTLLSIGSDLTNLV